LAKSGTAASVGPDLGAGVFPVSAETSLPGTVNGAGRLHALDPAAAASKEPRRRKRWGGTIVMMVTSPVVETDET
jgi:hypothetical protein